MKQPNKPSLPVMLLEGQVDVLQEAERNLIKEVAREYGADVLRLAVRLVGPTDGKDVAQNAFLRLIRYLRTKSAEKREEFALSSRLPLLHKMTALEAYSFWRTKSSRRVDLTETGDAPDSNFDGVNHESARVAEKLHLDKKIEELPPAQRLVFVFRHFYGYTSEEVAKLLEQAPGNIRVVDHRVKKALKRAMEGKK